MIDGEKTINGRFFFEITFLQQDIPKTTKKEKNRADDFADTIKFKKLP